MLEPLASWTHTLRGQMRRRAVERQLLDVVARLPQEPESRWVYQRLLEEHMKLAVAAEDSGRGQHDVHAGASEHGR
jgi:hypothetical protein